MAGNGWGTAVKWSGYNRKTQVYNSYSETDIQKTYVTYSVYGCARSGDGGGYYYASDWGVTVTLQYSVNNGTTWTTLGSQYGTLDYGSNVASITRSVTIYRTTANQNVKFRSKAVTSGVDEVAYSDSPTTVYALESYTVGYNLNGASGTAPSNQTKYYSKTLTLRSDIPTRSGYSFLGWATTSSATEAEYAPGASYTANAAATMYAIWSLDYKIPAIGEIMAYRCDANGNAFEDGTRCHILFGWELDSTASGATLDIVATTISNGQTVTLQCVSGATLSNNPYEAVIQPSGGFDTEKSYNLSVTITDSNGRSGFRTSFLSQSYVPIDCSPEGGIGIGTVAPSSRMLDIGIDVNIDGNLTFNSSNGSYGSAQDISSYNSASNRYTFLSDGLLRVESSYRASSYALAHVYNADGTELFIIEESSAKTEMMGNQSNCVPVFAGMSAYFERNSSVPYGSMYFIPRIDDIGVVVSERHVYERDVLYDNSEGDEGTITLSASAANYDHMVIYFTNRSVCSSVEVYKPNGKNANLFIGGTTQAGGVLWPLGRDISISGNTISTRDSVRYYGAQSATSTGYTLQKVNVMYIYRVEAW